MSFDQGIDLRNTTAYRTDDPANVTVEIVNTADYPTAPSAGSSADVGWLGSPYGLPLGTANATGAGMGSGIDARLAGYAVIASVNVVYEIDCPAGTYTLELACGAYDAAASGTANVSWADGTGSYTTLFSGVSVSAGHFADTNGTVWSASAWPGSNTTASVTVSSGKFRILFNGGAGNMEVAHIRLYQAAPAFAGSDFAVDRIFQRVGTAKTIPFAGTWSGTAPTGVAVEVIDASSSSVLVNWTTLSSFSTTGSGSGTWSGTLSVPQYNGWMKWKASTDLVNHTSPWSSSNQFGVGALFLFIGQSEMAYMWGRASSSPPTANANTRRYAGAGWKHVDDATEYTGEVADDTLGSPSNTNVRNGDGIITFANLMNALLSITIGVLEYAVGATAIAAWESTSGTQYTWTKGPSTSGVGVGSGTVSGVTYGDVGGDWECTFWTQGVQDVLNGTSAATYQAGLNNVLAWSQSLTGRSSIPFGLLPLDHNAAHNNDSAFDTIRNTAQMGWMAPGSRPSGVFFAGSMMESSLQSDGTHWQVASQIRAARRMVQAYGKVLGLTPYGADGPIMGTPYRLASALNIIRLPVTTSGGFSIQDGAGGTGGSLNGFCVSDTTAGTALTIAATTITGGEVHLTLSTSPASGHTLTVGYECTGSVAGSDLGAEDPHVASGSEPVLTPNLALYVFDNSTPQGDTVGLPMQSTAAPVTVTLETVSTTYRRSSSALGARAGTRQV